MTLAPSDRRGLRWVKSPLPTASMSDEEWEAWFRETHYLETAGYHQRMKALREQAQAEYEESKW